MSAWILALQIATLAVLGAVAGLTYWIFHKTWKIHLATFRIAQDARHARRESAALFQQLQAARALEATLAINSPLPTMRGWAGSPDFLLTVAHAVLNRKPVTVLECSSGVSTLVIARCLQINGGGHAYSLEHDAEYASRTSQMLKQYGVSEWATVLHAPLTSLEQSPRWYDDSVIPEGINAVELLVVDGPPHDVAPLARLPALPRLLPRMAESALVILDDADRDAEVEIVKRWVTMAPEFRASHLPHEKGCAVLERGGAQAG